MGVGEGVGGLAAATDGVATCVGTGLGWTVAATGSGGVGVGEGATWPVAGTAVAVCSAPGPTVEVGRAVFGVIGAGDGVGAAAWTAAPVAEGVEGGVAGAGSGDGAPVGAAFGTRAWVGLAVLSGPATVGGGVAVGVNVRSPTFVSASPDDAGATRPGLGVVAELGAAAATGAGPGVWVGGMAATAAVKVACMSGPGVGSGFRPHEIDSSKPSAAMVASVGTRGNIVGRRKNKLSRGLYYHGRPQAATGLDSDAPIDVKRLLVEPGSCVRSHARWRRSDERRSV